MSTSRAVRKSIAKKTRRLIGAKIESAFQFKSGKTVKNLLDVFGDPDSLAYFKASQANKRGIKSYKGLKNAIVKNTPKAIAGVSAASGFSYAGAKLKAKRDSVLAARTKRENSFTVANKTFTDPKIGAAKKTLADGYKYVYGKIRRIRGN